MKIKTTMRNHFINMRMATIQKMESNILKNFLILDPEQLLHWLILSLKVLESHMDTSLCPGTPLLIQLPHGKSSERYFEMLIKYIIRYFLKIWKDYCDNTHTSVCFFYPSKSMNREGAFLIKVRWHLLFSPDLEITMNELN